MEAQLFLHDTWLSLSEIDSNEHRQMSFQLRIVPCYAAMLWGMLTVDIFSLSHGNNFAMMILGVVAVYLVSFLWLAYSLPNLQPTTAIKFHKAVDPELLKTRRAQVKTYFHDHRMSWRTSIKAASSTSDNSFQLLSGSNLHSTESCSQAATEKNTTTTAFCDRVKYQTSDSSLSETDTTPTKLTSAGDCCVLCLDPYQAQEQIVRSENPDCSHWYHEECFVDYLMCLAAKESKTGVDCPTCRQWYCSKKVIDWNT